MKFSLLHFTDTSNMKDFSTPVQRKVTMEGSSSTPNISAIGMVGDWLDEDDSFDHEMSLSLAGAAVATETDAGGMRDRQATTRATPDA